MRPEQGLIGLRRALDVYANLRPATGHGIDLLIVRELVGGLYYGASGRRPDGSAFDTCEYTPAAIERIARRGVRARRGAPRHVTSVDKANVLETSRLWRETVTRVAADYPDVELEHMLVDTAGLMLVQSPGRFDVLLTENTFGDILSDVAAGTCGGLGLAASASLGDSRPGIFEPVHGSAPDIAGQGIANPAAMLRSVALLLRQAAEEPELAAALEQRGRPCLARDADDRPGRERDDGGVRRRGADAPRRARLPGAERRRLARAAGARVSYAAIRSSCASERAMSSSPCSRHSRGTGRTRTRARARRDRRSAGARGRPSSSPPSATASISERSSAGGSTIGTSPILRQFVAKMSPNEGAITTSKP